LGAPIKEMNAGKSFVLVSNDHSNLWPNVRGHVLSANFKGDKLETSIDLSLDPELGSLFASLTKANIRNQLAIVVNGIVRSAPVINAEIGQQVSITGIFEKGEAQRLGQWLQEGMVVPMPEVSTDLDKNPTMEPFLKTYKLTQIAPKIAYDVVASLLVGKPNVKLAVDEQNQTLILLAGPTEHDLIGQTLTEWMRADAAQTENLSLVTKLKEQQFELEQKKREQLTIMVDNHPSVLVTQQQIRRVQSQIQELRKSQTASNDPALNKLVALQNNLKQLGLGFHLFNDAEGRFPGTSNTHDANGEVSSGKNVYPFSWRVAILPWIAEGELHQRYRFHEPWDSEHNLTLLDKMPAIFRSPFAKADQEPGETNILGFRGKNSALGTGGGEAIGTFKDGIANTILLIEAECTVPWTKPQDIPEDAGSVRFFGDHPITFLMANGKVRSETISHEELLKLISRNGGEAVK
jgi:hypothetical protein